MKRLNVFPMLALPAAFLRCEVMNMFRHGVGASRKFKCTLQKGYCQMKKFSLFTTVAVIALGLFLMPAKAQAQIEVLTVDCDPFGLGGFTTTMGQAIQAVDPGAVFNVTEVTPVGFRAMTVADLSAFNLIAVNNDFGRLGCDPAGLGTVWHDVVGVDCGGRIVLSSHDAPRFHMNFTFGFGFFPGPGVPPFGADDLVLNSATWAGSGSGTGLLIFNDSNFSGGLGWDNIELSLPGGWGISDALVLPFIVDGGYTDILPPFDGVHPLYTTPSLLSDGRFAVNSINSFAANIGDASYHSVFATFNAAIFTQTEAVINSGVVDVGGFGCCALTAGPPLGRMAWRSR